MPTSTRPPLLLNFPHHSLHRHEPGVGPAATAILRAISKHLKMPKISTNAYFVDDVRAASAPNAETGDAAAFEARRRDGLWGYHGRCLCVDECRSALVCAVSLFRVRGTGKSQSHAIVLSVCVCAFSRTIYGHKEVPHQLSFREASGNPVVRKAAYARAPRR